MSDNGSPIEFYHKNPRQITVQQFENLERWLEELGDLSGVVHDLNSNQIIGGNQRGRIFDINDCEIVLAEEYDQPDEQGTVAIGYILWKGYRYGYRQARWTEEQCEMANIVANRAGGDWDFDILANEFELDDLLNWGFIEHDLDLDLWLPEPPEDPGAQIDRAEELREKWGVETGQLWQLGEHRLICGDCTDAEVVDRVMDGENGDGIIIDPPYSSGGFQEAGKSGGSIGTRKNDVIQADNLSTRGYRHLLLDALSNFRNVDNLYIFTDWRMWIECFDVSERAGWKARSMLVWDKEQMGMGLPWRSQHELILYGKQTSAKMLDGKCGNVLHATRTGNENHPTEKPVELIAQLIENTTGKLFVDFFLGSGTTLIACERLGRKCRAVEISPAYVAVAIQRWVDMTGGEPELMGDPHGIEEPSQY